MRTKPTAVFMAFGTKGDVYPIAAIAAAFASDQGQYQVAFVTHSAHEVFSISQKLKVHLEAKRITYFPVSSPPVMSYQDTAGSSKVSFSLQKNEIMIKHRQECVSIAEGIFGEDPHMDGDLIIINFFALEGWSLAELFQVRCVVAAPYVVPYSAPSSFERQFQKELPLLYEYLQDAPTGWEDVIYWMWPLFTEDWGLWRSHDLHLSFLPFTDPVTGLPRWHERPLSPLLLYGFSKEVVECPDYWPSRVQTCGFWFLPFEWQFSCSSCADISAQRFSRKLNAEEEMCSIHVNLKTFLNASPNQPIFMSLSSIGSMGYLKNPRAFLKVLGNALNITSCRFILFSAGYGPLDAEIKMSAQTLLSPSEQLQLTEDQTSLFGGRLFYFSGDVPYNWLFPKCAAAIHHGGSGSTAAALHAGIPQVICPFVLDQYYWAERMFWLGVAPEPLKNTCLLPDKDDDCYIKEAATMLVKAINRALSPEVKLQASRIANRLSAEDGVSEAVRLIREEINCTSAAL
ncbi:sterol 3-beta-glucosyltransferase isoform X2 [Henckelia pumila]|uniref:sterol 3-beta-glucosyltransferase isoform X2 n=1 Tax=Henckelia pumila TaxID=405737 RepID=UPI003C6DF612